MGAMYEFLQRLDTRARPRAVPRPRRSSGTARAQALNERLRAAGLPVRVANLSSIWTICYTQPSRYNWMFQYYLRAAGLRLELGRHRAADLQPELHRCGFRGRSADAFVGGRAGDAGGRLVVGRPALTNKSIRRRVLKEMLQARWSVTIGSMSSPRSR